MAAHDVNVSWFRAVLSTLLFKPGLSRTMRYIGLVQLRHLLFPVYFNRQQSVLVLCFTCCPVLRRTPRSTTKVTNVLVLCSVCCPVYVVILQEHQTVRPALLRLLSIKGRSYAWESSRSSGIHSPATSKRRSSRHKKRSRDKWRDYLR